MIAAAAFAVAVLLVGVACLQAALSLGAPLGRYAWGGRHGDVLPARLQVASAISVPILLVMALIVLIRASVLYPGLAPAMLWPCWAIFLFLVINTFANLSSTSAPEKRVMTPWAGTTAILVGYVNLAI